MTLPSLPVPLKPVKISGMNKTLPKYLSSLFVAALVLASCATVRPGDADRVSLLPPGDGWYRMDFTRTFRGIEDEHNFAVNFGMRMIQELTWTYTGVVVGVEDGFLFDPVTGIELFVDAEGWISSPENMSVRGSLDGDGVFRWSGLREEHGRMNSVFVRGTLTPIPRSARGGPEFDGVFHMTDSGTGRRILARVADGFYTWSFADGGEAGFTPWPTMVCPDGTFSFDMDMATVMEIVDVSSQNFSTGVSVRGVVVPGQGISMEEVTRTAGLGVDGFGDRAAPQVFSGMVIRDGEFPNEAIPENIETLLGAGRSAARALPRPNPANYPEWYINVPRREGYIFATGEKTFGERETAMALAQAAAAAGLADQVMLRIVAETVEVTGSAGVAIDTRIRTEALHRLDFRVVEQYYNTSTQTAFVLLEMRME